MNEHSFVKALHTKLDRQRYKIWKINDTYQGGVPDAFYKKKNHVGPLVWVEYKYIKDFPKRDSTLITPGISVLQREWLNDLYYSGQCAAVVLGVGKQVVSFYTPEEWTDGLSCALAKQRATSRADYLLWLIETMESTYVHPQSNVSRPKQITPDAPVVEREQGRTGTEPS